MISSALRAASAMLVMLLLSGCMSESNGSSGSNSSSGGNNGLRLTDFDVTSPRLTSGGMPVVVADGNDITVRGHVRTNLVSHVAFYLSLTPQRSSDRRETILIAGQNCGIPTNRNCDVQGRFEMACRFGSDNRFSCAPFGTVNTSNITQLLNGNSTDLFLIAEAETFFPAQVVSDVKRIRVSYFP